MLVFQNLDCVPLVVCSNTTLLKLQTVLFLFFSKFCASKSGVRLTCGCGLYTDIYDKSGYIQRPGKRTTTILLIWHLKIPLSIIFVLFQLHRKKLSNFSKHMNWKHAANYVAKQYIDKVPRSMYFDDVRLQMDAKLWGEEYNRYNPPKKVRLGVQLVCCIAFSFR